MFGIGFSPLNTCPTLGLYGEKTMPKKATADTTPALGREAVEELVRQKLPWLTSNKQAHEAVVAVLNGGPGVPDGPAARRRVLANYGWEANLKVLDRVLAP